MQDSKLSRKVDPDADLTLEERQLVVNNALNTEYQDAEDMLQRMRARFDACVSSHALKRQSSKP